LWSSATYQIHTTKKQIKAMEDLKGLKIIAWNRTSVEILTALGANPIQMPPTDSYLALERGMADGVLCPLAPIVSFKISDAAKYTTICDLFVNGFWAAMSHDLYKSLSPKAQDAFTTTTGQVMARQSGLTLDQGAVTDAEKLTAKGHTFYVLPQAERQRMIEATSSLRENWVKDMEAKGIANARAMMEDAYALGAKYAGETGRGFKE
jgi:TRAP-type C4-dicarboxylate transport system substrate-binding protein